MGILASIIGIAAVSPVRYYFNRNPIRLEDQAAESIEAFGFEPVIPASLDMDIAMNHAGIVLLIVLICTIYPIITILRLKPVKAMRA